MDTKAQSTTHIATGQNYSFAHNQLTWPQRGYRREKKVTKVGSGENSDKEYLVSS